MERGNKKGCQQEHDQQATNQHLQLTCVALTKSYQNTLVFRQLNVVFEAQNNLLVGKNGSGKSTLLRIIAGLEQANSGSLNWTPKQAPRVALASESVLPPDVFTANEVFDLLLRYQNFDTQKQGELVAALGFEAFLNRRIDELSSGSLKKLLLICAIAQQSDVLLLDEPFANLDEQSKSVIKKVVSEDSRFKIIVDHHQLLEGLQVVHLDANNTSSPS